MDIGLSLKSKTLSDREFDKLKDGGRVYMELANSPAIIWNEMKGEQLSEEDFHQRKQADKFGETLVKTFSKWQDEASKSNKDLNKRPINLKDSVFWCVSMKKPSKGATRSYKIHTFSLKMPKIKKWLFRSDRCLSGFDPKNENEVLFDWYGLSGGQAKYYPSSDTSLYSTNQINTIQLKEVNIIELIKRHWPEFKLG